MKKMDLAFRNPSLLTHYLKMVQGIEDKSLGQGKNNLFGKLPKVRRGWIIVLKDHFNTG
jgi:hypothetical protein